MLFKLDHLPRGSGGKLKKKMLKPPPSCKVQMSIFTLRPPATGVVQLFFGGNFQYTKRSTCWVTKILCSSNHLPYRCHGFPNMATRFGCCAACDCVQHWPSSNHTSHLSLTYKLLNSKIESLPCTVYLLYGNDQKLAIIVSSLFIERIKRSEKCARHIQHVSLHYFPHEIHLKDKQQLSPIYNMIPGASRVVSRIGQIFFGGDIWWQREIWGAETPDSEPGVFVDFLKPEPNPEQNHTQAQIISLGVQDQTKNGF